MIPTQEHFCFVLGLAEACSDNTMNQSLGSLALCPDGQGLLINNSFFAKLSKQGCTKMWIPACPSAETQDQETQEAH